MRLENSTTVIQKAVSLNRDSFKYGCFAEIGAGQEVARWFFHVGGASGTVAKSISAYDMKFSDAIYGSSERYVCRQRLISMLNHEYDTLIERLDQIRGSSTTFFAYANTVSASSYTFNKVGQGWMGIRFQTKPKEPPSEVILHVRMLDKDNPKQQALIGLLGVNLIYGALYSYDNVTQLISILKEGLEHESYEVDMINFSGPAFANVDNRVINLELVKQQLTNAIILNKEGQVIQASELLYKKPILIERGEFRPVTNITLDVLNLSLEQFCSELKVSEEDVVVLMEISTRSFGSDGEFDQDDFLARVEMLQKLNKTVLVSNYSRDFRLASYLANYTDQKIAFAMGIPHLKQVFSEDSYEDLDGGILESFGRLFRKNVKFYIYPVRDRKNGRIITVDNLETEKHLKNLYKYLLENKFIEGINKFNPRIDFAFPKEIIEKIQLGDQSWENFVPVEICQLIKNRKYFQYKKTFDECSVNPCF